jgi:hypothetical protein
MKKMPTAGLMLMVTLTALSAVAQDRPSADKSSSGDASQHSEWHMQLVGDWEIAGMKIDGSEISVAETADAKPIGTEKFESFGSTWVTAEGLFVAPGGFEMKYKMTVGFDPAKKKFVGSWICDQMPDLWVYEGSVDEAGTTLTLEAEGPNPSAGGKLAKFRDCIEMKDKDNRIHRSMIQGEDGNWTTFATAHYRRKK